MMHDCIIEVINDPFAIGDDHYMVKCRCHAKSWQSWTIGDEPYFCPTDKNKDGVRWEVTINGDD